LDLVINYWGEGEKGVKGENKIPVLSTWLVSFILKWDIRRFDDRMMEFY
jgi:hypothetical protein